MPRVFWSVELTVVGAFGPLPGSVQLVDGSGILVPGGDMSRTITAIDGPTGKFIAEVPEAILAAWLTANGLVVGHRGMTCVRVWRKK